MKKLCLIATLLVSFTLANAQHTIYPFFDDHGAVRIETQELNDAADTLVSVFHRADDIVWSKIVYRVIDLRYKQNFQLYFPVRSDDAQYRNMLKVVVDGIATGLPVYRKDPQSIKPNFNDVVPMENIPNLFMTAAEKASSGVGGDDDDYDYDNGYDDYTYDGGGYDDQEEAVNTSNSILWYDSISQKLNFDGYAYEDFARNQVKYMIQEIVFFDKHYSRLYSKIIAIAPMHPAFIQSSEDLMAALNESILFWLAFDELRPYLAKQYMIPNTNDNHRMTYDEFFAKKLYTSYIIGDSNMYDRMFLNYAKSAEEIRREQQRVFDELLNFEQDLWEY